MRRGVTVLEDHSSRLLFGVDCQALRFGLDADPDQLFIVKRKGVGQAGSTTNSDGAECYVDYSELKQSGAAMSTLN